MACSRLRWAMRMGTVVGTSSAIFHQSAGLADSFFFLMECNVCVFMQHCVFLVWVEMFQPDLTAPLSIFARRWRPFRGGDCETPRHSLRCSSCCWSQPSGREAHGLLRQERVEPYMPLENPATREHITNQKKPSGHLEGPSVLRERLFRGLRGAMIILC